MQIRLCFALLASSILSLPGIVRAAPSGVEMAQEAGKVRIAINGKLFTEYNYQDVPRPFFYPLLGPEELPMTRRWPMEQTTDEEHDHPHHRSLWYGHGNVNGLDFWTEEKNFGKIVHKKFLLMQSGPEMGILQSEDNWVAPDGTVVCSDIRTFRVFAKPDDQRLFDFDITLVAPTNQPVTFGDSKEGSMGVRLAESMRLSHKNGPGEGHIVLSSGVRDKAAWGKRADWCDYSGPIHGQTVGIAIFDHPQNPRHPTWWHVRDYGLFAANPFGLHEFEKKPPGAGNFIIPAGQSATFRYRFYIHQGDEQQGRVAEQYQKYVYETPNSP